ncbi:UNVERIFIED_CONTAM: hypothetical protein Slati_2639900 [Sesamum latifolium]|uniref:Uncharacterized protein n=1 Tax=Sesamum latifolium TaxID=2727402 RepID=A0AAW2VVX6_9LAMI
MAYLPTFSYANAADSVPSTKAESYYICNWCLDKKGELQGNTKASSPNSSSSSLKTPSDHQDHMKMNKGKRVLGGNHGGLKDTSDHIKKQKKSSRTMERSGPSSAGRKRVTTDHHGKKTRSEEVSNGGVNIIKQVFRNKVRRYKLLDEVSS